MPARARSSNALTGPRQKVANYPGVTVERHAGTLRLAGGDAELIDLPGTYSLAAQSPTRCWPSMRSSDASGARRPAVVLVVVDASNRRRNLDLASQVLGSRGPWSLPSHDGPGT